MPTSRSARIIYTSELDPSLWLARHARGEVPGRFPYGLHCLAEQGLQLQTEVVQRPGRNPIRWIGLADPRLRRTRLVNRNESVIAWDESTVVPMLLRYGRSGRRLIGGLIWETDSAATRPHSVRSKVLKEVYRRLDDIWVLSRGQLPVLQEWLKIDAARLHFIPFGIDTAYFPPSPFPSRPTILSLGNDRDRDPRTLFEALRLVLLDMPHARVVVQSRSQLEAPPGVEVFPSLSGPEIRDLYRQASVVVIATKHNLHVSGMTTVLEAMSTGRPVVMNMTPGAEDYVKHGATGYLVPPAQVPAMAGAILKILRNHETLAQMGAAAAAYVRASHTESTMARALADVIRA